MAMMNLLCLVSSFFLLFTYCDLHLIRNKREALRKVQCQETVKSLDLTGEGEGVLTLQTETFQGSYNDSKGNVNEYSFDAYKPNQNCLFDVFTNTGTQMVWTSDEFAIEESDDCMFDYLEIEGKKFCGWKPLIYITKSSYVGSVFKSDESYEDRGYTFVIKEQKVDTLTYCNNTVSGDGSKTITNSIDPAGQNCFYRIETADKNKVVQLTLEKVNFESTNCEEESVIIYEGQSSHGQKKMVICPNTTQQVFPFHAKAFFIEYRNLLNSEREEAFKIKCDFVEDNFLVTTPAPTTASPVGGNNDCSGRFNSEMVYTSPYMENNKHCVIVIRNTMIDGYIVQAKFEYFDIEDSENCSFDSLQIYSGEREESDPLGGPYCGDSLNGRIITSRGNSLRLEFKTDESFALRGFKVDISFESAYDCSCENKKICIQQGYEKLCLAGKECDSQLCLDKGRCVEYKGNKKCYCNPGYDGEYCSNYTGDHTDQPLRFKKAPPNRKIEKGKSIHTECELDVAQGVEVYYDWYLNGQSIADYNGATGFGALPGGVLSIKEFSEDYDGQYMCIGRTKFGSAEHIFRYETVSKCEVVITSGPGDVQWNVGQSVLIPCRVNTGRGSVQINWKKDGIPIDLSDPRYEIISQSYLQISELELNDAGSYSCHVEDKNGCPSSRKGTLKIIDYKPLNDYCGISTWDETLIPQVRLSKSEKSRPNEDPWYVNFRTKAVRGKPEITFCGGSLISQKYVLTAAHCISGFDLLDYGAFSTSTVSLSLGTISCLGGGVQRSFRKYTIHPRFNNMSYDNDIALIELDSPVEYDASIRPICLADKTTIDKTFFEDARSRAFRTVGRVIGCGKRSTTGPLHDFLQYLHIEYVPEEKCEESFLKNNLNKTSSMFCAGSEVARKGDACQGDSGSPFVMYDNGNRRIQTGIVSWGVGCDVADFTGVYTNVGMFYDWIAEVTDFDTEKVENFLG